MRIGVVGINHKLAELGLRERLAKVCQKRFSPDSSTHGKHAFVLLSTCNRTEIYFSSDDLAETHSYILSILRNHVEEEHFDQKLYSYFGLDCFFHLAKVTAGLDSAIVAETEIQGQVKTAYENAAHFVKLPHAMHYIFQKSLKIGKLVRAKLPLKAGLPDIEDAIFHTGSHLFTDPKNASILCVGASEINVKVIKFLKRKQCHNITIINRTNWQAEALAKELRLQVMEWEKLSTWQNFDWIIFGTKSGEFLLKEENVTTLKSQKLIIDLSVPRNVDPQLEKHIPLLNIDQINQMLKTRRRHLNDTLTQAENSILEYTKHHYSLFQHREQPFQTDMWNIEMTAKL